METMVHVQLLSNLIMTSIAANIKCAQKDTHSAICRATQQVICGNSRS